MARPKKTPTPEGEKQPLPLTPVRIYVVDDPSVDQREQLVRASSATTALRCINRRRGMTAKVADQETILRLAKDGGGVIDARDASLDSDPEAGGE